MRRVATVLKLWGGFVLACARVLAEGGSSRCSIGLGKARPSPLLFRAGGVASESYLASFSRHS
jgi:hypothetical protein